MEDAHTIQMAMTKHESHGFFGVYDGHNGDVCAHWSAANLWKYIDGVEDLSEGGIQKACLEADKEFLTNDPESFVKKKKRRAPDLFVTFWAWMAHL